jgi:hypothetical protein
LALTGPAAPLLEYRAGQLQGPSHDLDRRGGVRGAADRAGKQVFQGGGAGEQHLSFVGEVPKEGPFGQPGPLGYLGHRRVLEAALDVELHRRLLEPTSGVGLPSTHTKNGS